MKNERNILILIFSKIFLLLSSFAVILFIAHTRDKDFLGKYSLVMTWIVIFKVIASLGIWDYISREIGKNPKETNKFLVHGLSLGFFSSILFAGLMIGIAVLLNYPKDIELAIFVGGLAVIPLTLSSICEGGFIAHKQVGYIAYISIFENIATTIVSVGLILNNYELIPLIAIFASIRVISFLLNLFIFHHKVCQLSFNIQLRFFRKFISSVSIFSAITILSTIFLKIDIIMLSKIKDVASVAMYAAAVKIMEALLIIPTASYLIYLPVIAKELQANNRDAVERLFVRITRALFVIILPFGLGIAYFAESIIITMYGEQYIGSIIALQILMLAFSVISIDLILGMLCKAADFQKIDLLVLIVNTLSNITINLILIPLFGYVGASVATVISICISLGLHYIFVNRNLIQLVLFKTLRKPLTATFLALLVLHPLQSKIHFVPHMMLFAVGYGLVLILLKGISINEIKSLLRVFTLYRVGTDSSINT